MQLRLKTKKDQLSDEELLELYKKKPSRAILGLLYRRHAHMLYGLCLSYLKNPQDAEDAVMDSFAELPPKISKYEIDDFESWLYLVVRNYCLKLLRQNAKYRIEELSEISKGQFVESPSADTLDMESRRIEVLSDAIDQLKGPQKRCIVLFYLEGHSYQEIAELASFSLNEVKSHIQNGRRNLKNLIQKLT